MNVHFLFVEEVKGFLLVPIGCIMVMVESRVGREKKISIKSINDAGQSHNNKNKNING